MGGSGVNVRDRVADRVLWDVEGDGDGADKDLDDLRRRDGRAALGCLHCLHKEGAGAGQSIKSLWALPSSMCSTASCTLATAGVWCTLSNAGIGGLGCDLLFDSSEGRASLRSAVACHSATGADGPVDDIGTFDAAFCFSWMRAARSASLYSAPSLTLMLVAVLASVYFGQMRDIAGCGPPQAAHKEEYQSLKLALRQPWV